MENTAAIVSAPVPPLTEGTRQSGGQAEVQADIKDEVQARRAQSVPVSGGHVRRQGGLILMAFTAVCGAAAGAVAAAAGEGAPYAILTGGSFLGIFLMRLAYGGIFLLAEYITGYFALGEWLVWVFPLLCGAGTAVSLISAADSRAIFLLPSACAVLCAAVFAARAAGDFSAELLRLARGGGMVFLDSSPARSYTFRFLGYLCAVMASGLYEAAVRVSVFSG